MMTECAGPSKLKTQTFWSNFLKVGHHLTLNAAFERASMIWVIALVEHVDFNFLVPFTNWVFYYLTK